MKYRATLEMFQERMQWLLQYCSQIKDWNYSFLYMIKVWKLQLIYSK